MVRRESSNGYRSVTGELPLVNVSVSENHIQNTYEAPGQVIISPQWRSYQG